MKKSVELHKNRLDSAWVFSMFAFGLSTLSLCSFGLLTSSFAAADDTVVDLINITVPVACSVESPTTDKTYSVSMSNGQLKSDIGSTTFNVVCNDTAGYAIYAIGYGNNTLGVTDMISSTNTSYNIATGTGTSGGTSNWAMKLDPISGTSAPTILNGFNSFHNVPSSWTKVVQFTQVVQSTVGSSFKSTYQIFVSPTQAAGTYTGKVRYHLIHPSTSCLGYTVHFDANGGSGTMNDQVICSGTSTPLTANAFSPPTGYEFVEWNTEPDGTGDPYQDSEPVTDLAAADDTITLYARWERPSINLYNTVASMTKGTQTAANLNATISSSNSGVYTYNSSVFGADSDGTKSDNTKATIYYYRGILDNTQGTYGSNGDAAAYPNYVVLSATGTKSTSDTCWRIIRTTGSGGVKMIYNGKWTGSTCANATTNAQLSSTSGFGASTSSNTSGRQIVRVGYTYSSTYASTSYTSNVAFNTVFGSNTVASADSVNNTDSTIKGNVESWYSSNLNAFTSILESNAGYCNDRYAFQTATGSSAATNVRPYTTSTQSASTSYPYATYFVGSQRNAQTTRTPSLGCSYNGSRNIVDLYSSDSSAGGNGQLDAPVALLTADEASFAGSGNSNSAANGSYYNAKSYLNTGSNFWTMTPYYRYGSRNSAKLAHNFYMTSDGNITNSRIDTAYGVRPVISLKEGTLATDGSGTAADPWVVPTP